jgi:hypothetical protein
MFAVSPLYLRLHRKITDRPNEAIWAGVGGTGIFSDITLSGTTADADLATPPEPGNGATAEAIAEQVQELPTGRRTIGAPTGTTIDAEQAHTAPGTGRPLRR